MENKELQDYAISVAQTIWQQICAGGVNIVMSWGVSKLGFTFSHGNPALLMWVNGFQFKGCVIIEYNVMDTYDIYFMKDAKYEKEIKDVYFDQLTDILDHNIEVGELTKEQYNKRVARWLDETT